MNRPLMTTRLKTTVASALALLIVVLAGIVFFQQPAQSASRVTADTLPGTDVQVAATAGAAEAAKFVPTLTPIPEDVSQSTYDADFATPIP